MKLMQIMASNKPGGAEAFFCRLANSLQQHTIEQILILRQHSPYLQQLQPRHHCYALPFSSHFDLRSRPQLKTIIDKLQPDIVLSWMNRASKLSGSCYNKSRTHVARLGGYYNLKYYQHCDQFIANTKGIADYLLRAGINNKRVHHIYNFVEEKTGVAQKRNNTRPLIVALGRLHRNKAFDTLIQAMTQVDDAELWIAGSGPEQQSLQRLIGQLNLGTRVQLLGWHPHPENLIATANLFVCPSRHEPLGNVILECWQQQKSIIATKSAGANELIQHGDNGHLVTIDDPIAMAQAINTLLKNPDYTNKLAQQGYHDYQATFTKSHITTQYLELFNQFI